MLSDDLTFQVHVPSPVMAHRKLSVESPPLIFDGTGNEE